MNRNDHSSAAGSEPAPNRHVRYASAVGALGRHAPRGARPPIASPPQAVSRVVARPERSLPLPKRCSAAPQRPQRRGALRENTPPWAVRLEHRFPGKLINVSRSGLAIELREAPPFYQRGRLRIDVGGESVHLEVAVQWCRLVGLEEIETDRGIETAPRFQLGLGCDDPALRRLGAPPAVGVREGSTGTAPEPVGV